MTAVFLFAASSALAAGGKSFDTLTIGVPTDRCPVFYQDKNTNDIIGIGADLMRIAAKKAGYDVTFRIIKEKSLKEALDSKAYDVILPFGSAVSSASGHSTVISDNLLQTTFTLVTENNRQLPPLNTLQVGMLRSLAAGAETVSQLYPGIKITFYETMDKSIKALREGKVDALLHNSYVWSYVLQNPSYSDLIIQPSTIFSMDFRAGTLDTPSGRTVIERLNSGIAALTDITRQTVILDYTTRKLYQYDLFDYLHEYGLFLLLISLLILSLIMITVLKLRTLRFEQEEKMRYLLDHDPLTGVLSLNGFRKRVEELLRAHPEIPYVLSYNNIKNFKYINDSLGMQAGNDLLCFWAEKSGENLSDIDAIGRIEADHFAALRHLEGEGQLSKDIKAVFEPIRNFFIDRDQETRVQISTGVYALTPADYRNLNVDQMLDYARVAEKRLRDEHREGFEFYNTDQWRIGKLVADVTSRLSVAIRSDEIQVWYQPQINFETGKIISAEALCRWNEEGSHRSVSVNLSRADLVKNQNIPEHFRNLIRIYELSPDQLHIEITETAYVENPDLLISTTQKFREYGFQVEMDDFGSGYSSLNMLKEVQVDCIKFDLRFLTETGDAEKGQIIIRYMIRMAQSLGINLIAEGVEKEEQARFLHELGCSEMQGFYFYRPMPLEEYEKLIRTDQE